jgi:hypothetical protein
MGKLHLGPSDDLVTRRIERIPTPEVSEVAPQIQYVDRVVEKVVLKPTKIMYIDRPIEVIKEVEKIVERIVEVPTDKVIEKIVEVEKHIIHEVEKPIEVIREVIREVEKPVEILIEKISVKFRLPTWAIYVMTTESAVLIIMLLSKLLK